MQRDICRWSSLNVETRWLSIIYFSVVSLSHNMQTETSNWIDVLIIERFVAIATPPPPLPTRSLIGETSNDILKLFLADSQLRFTTDMPTLIVVTYEDF